MVQSIWRFIRFLLVAILALVCISSAGLYLYSIHTPTYIALVKDRLDTSRQPSYKIGSDLAGIFSGGGKIGILFHSEQEDTIDGPQNALPPEKPHLIWDHAEITGSVFQGGISLNELAYFLVAAKSGFEQYDAKEGDGWAGGWEFTDGRLMSVWNATLIPLVLVLLLYATTRIRFKKMDRHLCPTCQYDLRAQIEGLAGKNCPECGAPVMPPIPAP